MKHFNEMKPFSFIVILVLGIVISGMMWQDPFLSIEDQGRPVIKFETTTLDLGEISYGSEGSCWFVLKNTGKSPLIITSVMTTCDCSASSWPKKPVYPDHIIPDFSQKHSMFIPMRKIHQLSLQ